MPSVRSSGAIAENPRELRRDAHDRGAFKGVRASTPQNLGGRRTCRTSRRTSRRTSGSTPRRAPRRTGATARQPPRPPRTRASHAASASRCFVPDGEPAKLIPHFLALGRAEIKAHITLSRSGAARGAAVTRGPLQMPLRLAGVWGINEYINEYIYIYIHIVKHRCICIYIYIYIYTYT